MTRTTIVEVNILGHVVKNAVLAKRQMEIGRLSARTAHVTYARCWDQRLLALSAISVLMTSVYGSPSQVHSTTKLRENAMPWPNWKKVKLMNRGGNVEVGTGEWAGVCYYSLPLRLQVEPGRTRPKVTFGGRGITGAWASLFHFRLTADPNDERTCLHQANADAGWSSKALNQWWRSGGQREVTKNSNTHCTTGSGRQGRARPFPRGSPKGHGRHVMLAFRPTFCLLFAISPIAELETWRKFVILDFTIAAHPATTLVPRELNVGT